MLQDMQKTELKEPSILVAIPEGVIPAVVDANAIESITRSEHKDNLWQTLARELHDGVTQEVWYLQTELAYMSGRSYDDVVELRSDLERLKKVAQEAYQELRTTLDLLNSQKAGYSYMARDLSELTRKFSESVNMKVLFDCDTDLLEKRVQGDVARQVRRLVQEALWNSLQHSMSETAIVNLKESKAGLMVTITDNGCGFDPDSLVTNHYGLRNMRERAEAINGRLFVTSQAGKGTQITLQIPREDVEG